MTIADAPGRVLRVGTRGSALALAQSGAVARILDEKTGAASDLVRIRTEGDSNPGALAEIGGTGVFVTAVRAALLDGRVDVIVHSFKDLPTAASPGVAVAAVPRREDASDALCARDGLSLARLPAGSTVGTGSPRRAAQLLARRPDLRVVPIRGNVDTRLRMVGDGRLDAVVLAAAGLRRLGHADAITELLAADVMLPAPAQGALAVECRVADLDTAWYASALAALDDATARAEVAAERAVLAALEAGCSAPVGARAVALDNGITLTAAVVAADGGREVRGETAGTFDTADDAAGLGRELAATLLADGAGSLLGAR